jgi:hypothetical protein
MTAPRPDTDDDLERARWVAAQFRPRVTSSVPATDLGIADTRALDEVRAIVRDWQSGHESVDSMSRIAAVLSRRDHR